MRSSALVALLDLGTGVGVRKHVGLLVDDSEATARHLRAKGVEIAADVATVEPAGVKNFWIRDNSGNLFEINQWLEPRDDEPDVV